MSRTGAIESEAAPLRAASRAFARDCLLALAGCAALLTIVAESSTGYWLGGAGVFLVSALVVRRSRAPLAYFGWTLAGARAALLRGFGFALLLSAGALAALYWLRARGGLDRGTPLVSSSLDLELLCYVVVAAPAQEWVFRGVGQGAARLLVGAHRRVAVVGIGTALYALSHLPWGAGAALLMVLPGALWGFQFERDRTLVGVGVSHALVGYLFVGMTPLWGLLTAAGR